MEISARTGKDDNSPKMTVDIDVPEDLGSLVEAYGEEAVYSRAKANIIIDLQAFMRSYMKSDGMTQEKLQEFCTSWKPGTKGRGQTTAEKLNKLMAQLTPEMRAEISERWADSDDE